MQYLTQLVVTVLLLWNVTVAKSASTASREFLSSLDTSEDDQSEDNNNSRNRDLSHSRPQSSVPSWRVENLESRSDGTKQQSHDNYGLPGNGFFTHGSGLMGDGSSTEKFRPPPPRLYSNGHSSTGATSNGLSDRINGNSHGQEETASHLRPQQQPHDDNEMEDGQPITDEETRILRAHLRNVISRTAKDDPFNEDIRKHFLGGPTRFFIPQSRTSFVVPPTALRTSKRSASCLRKCMAMGFLHPSQCHSLC